MKHKIEIAPLTDYYVIVVKDKNTDKLIDTFTLNESATDMLKLFYQGYNIKEVAQEISTIYEVSFYQVSKDISAFAKSLHEKGIL